MRSFVLLFKVSPFRKPMNQHFWLILHSPLVDLTLPPRGAPPGPQPSRLGWSSDYTRAEARKGGVGVRPRKFCMLVQNEIKCAHQLAALEYSRQKYSTLINYGAIIIIMQFYLNSHDNMFQLGDYMNRPKQNMYIAQNYSCTLLLYCIVCYQPHTQYQHINAYILVVHRL